MHSPLAIANAIVASDPGRTPMAVNKLVHLVHGWSLANGRGVVSSLPEVWRFGPIYRDVYDAFKRFGHDPIGMAMPFDGTMHVPVVPDDDAWTWSIVRKVVEAYRNDDEYALSEICHAPDSAWKRTAERYGFSVPIGTKVAESDMLEHFRRKLSIDVGLRARRAA